MSRRRLLMIPVFLAITPAGCISVDLPEEVTLLPIGTSFVVKGTATMLGNGEPCLAWLGDNGVVYHLFQGRRVNNEDFDLVATPGVRSRLEIATRKDLVLDCATGTLVEVESILEIIE